jgi:hypothetical protein
MAEIDFHASRIHDQAGASGIVGFGSNREDRGRVGSQHHRLSGSIGGVENEIQAGMTFWIGSPVEAKRTKATLGRENV